MHFGRSLEGETLCRFTEGTGNKQAGTALKEQHSQEHQPRSIRSEPRYFLGAKGFVLAGRSPASENIWRTLLPQDKAENHVRQRANTMDRWVGGCVKMDGWQRDEHMGWVDEKKDR